MIRQTPKRRPGSGTWPDSRWQELLSLASDLLSELPPGIAWTFGGGTRLAQLYAHRISYDVDIFVTDAQALGFLSPRLNDRAALLFGEDYDEDSNFLKLRAAGGDVDVIVGAMLTSPGAEPVEAAGRRLMAQTAEEIMARKFQYRGHAFTHRDCFDLATLLQHDPARVERALDACAKRSLERLRQRLELFLPVLTAELPEYVNPTPPFTHLLTEAAPRIRAWLDA